MGLIYLPVSKIEKGIQPSELLGAVFRAGPVMVEAYNLDSKNLFFRILDLASKEEMATVPSIGLGNLEIEDDFEIDCGEDYP